MRILEAAGYVVTRAGGSLGIFDLVAIGPHDVVCLQVKAGSARLSKAERTAIAALPTPENVRRACWRFPDRARAPLIERL